ncbi:hypothetical protein G647_03960 [Cladophialophora carrionii CBS 160.54]|uniref:Major facilitator superfamily (MFS) profile domain-containing protein n=1 Tax=Cladophialophora carrionii CBS 160.54 TaxID=1279043 RepID=V9DD31_9EURO|nr:uncharacterized protein G647_03960 [Cladophialophora carrionii CBS 160.54]ETI24591.1 hypothetical protein G647_03960 [Cladophialophora carrionii CBS 160.54]
MFQDLRGSALVWAITLSSGSCYVLFGYDQGVLGGLVAQPSFLDAIGNPSASYLGTIVALYNIGCLAGCMAAAVWGNVFGRRKTVLIGCSIMVVGAIIQTATYGAGQLIAGRLISGLGNGLNTSTIPVYVSETARSHRRGQMVAVQLSIVIAGIVLAYWIDYATVHTLTGEVVWRFPIAFQNVFALITMATMPFLPETPRWLYSHGRKPEAVTVLARLMDTTEDDEQVQFIKNEMEEALELEKQQPSFSLKQLGEKSDLKPLRRLVLCFMVQFFQQFTGINVIVFYVTIVLEQNMGLSSNTSSLVAGFIQIAFWVGTLPPIYYLDKYGRRPTLLIGSVVLLISLVLFTAGIAVNTDSSNNLALAMLILFQITFGMSWNATPWIYAPEITPLQLRHVGSAVGPFSEWLCTFVIVQMTPTAVEHTGWKIYLLFVIMTALSIPYVYFFLPETTKMTLEEIDYIFVKGEARERLHDRVQETGRRNSLAGKSEKNAEVTEQKTEYVDPGRAC